MFTTFQTRRIIISSLIFSFFAVGTLAFSQVVTPTPDPRSVGSTLELHINDNGKITISGAQVMQKAGTTLYVRLTWGTTFMRWTIFTNANTSFVRRFGGQIAAPDISVGDFISVEGDFLAGTDTLTITASKIKDWSLGNEPNSFSGTVSSIATGNTTFVLQTAGAAVTVNTNSGTSFTKGLLTVSFHDLRAGDKIIRTAGSFDVAKSILIADSVEIYQDKSVFTARNFEGTLKSLTATMLPTEMRVTSEGKEYTVYVPASATILTKARNLVSLSRFIIGDTVRFYGSIRQNDLSAVDAIVVRNISL